MSNPAITYEREMVPVVFGPWVRPLLDIARLRQGERVLDLACGTGIVARTVAAANGHGTSVVGLDMNPAMLAVARERARSDDLSIEWHEGRSERLPFADASFDVVLCQQGLQFFPDQPAALREARRVLDVHGRLVIAVWRGLDRHPFYAGFNEAIVRHLGLPALAAPFSIDDPDDLRHLLEAAGFDAVRVEARTMDACFPDPGRVVRMEVDVIAAAIPSAQHLDGAQRAQLAAAIEDELAPLVRAHSARGELVVPYHAHLVSAARGDC